jgi:hypothetical protein
MAGERVALTNWLHYHGMGKERRGHRHWHAPHDEKHGRLTTLDHAPEGAEEESNGS